MEATRTAAVAAPASVRREGLAWAFAGVLLFSFSVPLTKEAVGGFSPFLTATGRAVIAGVMAAALLTVRRAPRPPARQMRPLLYTMLGAVFGWPILLALALERTTSAHVAVIAAFMPLTQRSTARRARRSRGWPTRTRLMARPRCTSTERRRRPSTHGRHRRGTG
jgi:hypothetical protein